MSVRSMLPDGLGVWGTRPRIFGIDYYYLNTYSIDDSFDFYCMYVILDYYTVPII